MIEELPEGWALTTLGEVTEPKVSQGEPKGTEFTYIDIASIDNTRKIITDPKKLPLKNAPSRARQHVRPGDVLVSMTRPNLNAVGVVSESLRNSIASTGFHVLRPREVLPEWLFALVRSTDFVTTMSELVQGALYPAVRPSDIRDFQIPLPPLAEQRRIVAKIEELTARSRAARAALAEVPTLLEQFRQSVLASAFRGDLTADWRAKNPNIEPASELLARIRTERRKQWEAKYPKKKYVEPEPVDDSDLPELPEGWCWATLPELTSPTESLCYGVVQPGESVEDGVKLIRVCDIRDGEIRSSELRKISAEIDREYARSRIIGGELLLTVVGTIGRVAVAPHELRGSNIARAVAKLVPCPSISATWLLHWFATSHMQDWLGREACEVARKTLNLKELDRAVIPLAPAVEMRQMATVIPRMLARTQAIVTGLTVAVEDLDRIDQSILAKAFRGELVPQDPTDEPASVLLERLRASQAEASTNGTTKRTRRKAGP